MANKFCHVEWQVTDMDEAKEFYGGMFEWTFQDMGDSYSLYTTGDPYLGGGLERKDAVSTAESPLVYVHVDNLETHLAKAETLGGSVIQRRTDIPGHGWFAIVTDPD